MKQLAPGINRFANHFLARTPGEGGGEMLRLSSFFKLEIFARGYVLASQKTVACYCCPYIVPDCARLRAKCARRAGGDADVDGGKQRGCWYGDGYSVACMVHPGKWNFDRGVLPAAGYGEFADAGIRGERREGDLGRVQRFAALAGASE